MTEVLRTGRLALHPVSMSDHRALLTHWTGPLVRRHLFDDRIVSPVQVTEIIAASQRDFATEGYGLWALRAVRRGGPAGAALDRAVDLAMSGASLVGVVGLRRHGGPGGRGGPDGLGGPDGRGVDVEILYSLEPDRWGLGLAAEASRAVLDYAFGVVGLHRVTAEIDAGNASSAEIAERLGMRPWRPGPDGPDGASYYAADRARWLGSRRAVDAVP
ncbi:GNAT family N-acetyltransferase [Actinomadura rubrisoli]|uniref:N-acetyltransferase n=1 Tax=Actinomadura rubrisoli TaxID=2530368 RepID=A0A4R5ARK1_9ACTN|nr:GNAT family protein [Actinomadura rubrisoli]TDD75758.1 N-acetyltransferase [Actinomadura rubrisoli]